MRVAHLYRECDIAKPSNTMINLRISTNLILLTILMIEVEHVRVLEDFVQFDNSSV